VPPQQFNFVGKLLGPKGNSMKRLQEDTMCKMAVLGRGSMRDRRKEEELRGSGDSRYAHLFEDLHVEISTFAAPAEAHARIAYALAEVRRFLVPVSRVNEASFLGQLPRHCLCLIPINDLSFVRAMGRQKSILKLARTRVLKLWPHGVHLDKKCTSIWKGIWNI